MYQKSDFILHWKKPYFLVQKGVPKGWVEDVLFWVFFGLGPKGVPKAAQGGPKGSSEGPKGVPSEAKVSSGGSQRGPKGGAKGSRGDQKTVEMEGKWGPCGTHAKNKLLQEKP